MTLANAGNPAPYCNGEEIAVEPGLPLGMIGEVNYAETRYQIAVGDQLTFVSDDVIEAADPRGELYGFERTRDISKQPANAIAEAARQFGQEDDITVPLFPGRRLKRTKRHSFLFFTDYLSVWSWSCSCLVGQVTSFNC
jgi:hypothetical protein